jgi:hypothetical protein
MRAALEMARVHLAGQDVIGVEVGVLRGEHSLEILKEWPEVRLLHLVDNYCENNIHELDDAKKRLKDYEKKIVWHVMSSREAAKRTIVGSRNFVYIDAGHSYEDVKDDMNLWWPKIRIGGVLCGHDYQFRWECMKGLVKAVDEFAKENNLELGTETSGSSSDWWIVKK